jgi:peptidoglycan/xylan/chitin deacetylase (PgdA/CDA1 family)
VLLHDGLECRDEPHQQNTVAALPQIIEDFRDRGYRFITITDIISDTSYAKDFRAAARVIAKPKRNYY